MDPQRCLQATSSTVVTGSASVAASSVSHGDLLHIKEEPEDADVEIGPTVFQHIDSYYRTNQTDVKQENAIEEENTIDDEDNKEAVCIVEGHQVLCSRVKVEIVGKSQKDMDPQRCLQATSSTVVTGSASVAASSVSQGDLLHIKEEPEDADVEIGPTVLQHIDSYYRTNQTDVKQENAIEQENTIDDEDNTEAVCKESHQVLCSRVKVEIVGKSQKDMDPQRCLQATSSTVVTGSASVAASSVSQGDLLHIKEEPEDTDVEIGPTVLQHIDSYYRTNQTDVKQENAIEEENTIDDEDNKEAVCIVEGHQVLCSRVKVEIVGKSQKDNKTILCNYCSRTTTEEDNDEEHLKSCLPLQKDLQQYLLCQRQATNSDRFKCNTCNSMFHMPHMLTAHQKLHQQNSSKISVTISSAVAGPSNQSLDKSVKAKLKPFECDVCQNGYSTKAALILHIRLHFGIGLYVCYICDAKFAIKSKLTNHLRTHTGEKPYHCDNCGAKFALCTDLTKHMRVHTGEKPYHCDKCSAKFTQSGQLSTHMRVHTGVKPYHCDKCRAKFSHNSALTRHMRVHTGEKPYHCDNCSATFRQSSHLSKHMRVHKGEKPYHCDKCRATFSHNCALTRHMRVHTGESVKPYHCDKCRAKFRYNCALTRHMRVHTGEKPYHCDKCSATFTRSNHLSTHMRVHTGEKPYHCDKCRATFSHNSALTRHMRVHTGEKPFECSECGVKFTRSNSLNSHMRMHHTK